MNAPAYTRPAYGQIALILVPKVEFQTKWMSVIKGGSAIVGYMLDSITLHSYYEGNLYGAANLTSFQERALCAYGRLTMRYPTIAQAAIPLYEFDVVGSLTPTSFEMHSTPSKEAWLALEESMVEALPVF